MENKVGKLDRSECDHLKRVHLECPKNFPGPGATGNPNLLGKRKRHTVVIGVKKAQPYPTCCGPSKLYRGATTSPQALRKAHGEFR